MTKIDQARAHPSNNVTLAWVMRLREALKGHTQKKQAMVTKVLPVWVEKAERYLESWRKEKQAAHVKKTHVAQEWAIEAHKK
jgi:hypothetical protein